MNYPPLKVWIITLSIFGVLFIVTTILSQKKAAYIFTKTVEYAFTRENESPNSMRIVFIGSSLLTNALSDNSIINSLRQEKVKPIDIVKIGIPRAVLKDYLTNECFIKKIIEYEPDLILIQESILQKQKINLLLNLKFVLSRKDLVEIWNGTYSVFNEARIQSVSHSNVFKDSAEVNPTSYFDLIDFDSNVEILEEFMKRTLDPSIVIAEVPLPWVIERARNTILKSSNYSDIKKSIAEKYKISFLSFDQPLYYEYFYDRTHMNNFGERIYTRWLLDQLDNMDDINNSAND